MGMYIHIFLLVNVSRQVKVSRRLQSCCFNRQMYENRNKWRYDIVWRRFCCGATHMKTDWVTWDGPGKLSLRKSYLVKWSFCLRGKTVPIQMQRGPLMTDDCGEVANLTVRVSSSQTLTKFFQGAKKVKGRVKWISESGAVVPEDPHSPCYNRNKSVWSLTLPLLLLRAYKAFPTQLDLLYLCKSVQNMSG